MNRDFEIPETDGEDGYGYTPEDKNENGIPDGAERKASGETKISDIMGSKKLKDTKFGKFLWKAGDTLVGKTMVGKVADSVLEILPVPNPIRYAKEITANKKLKSLKANQQVINAARENGFEFDELIDESPSWVKPAMAIAALIGIFVLVGLGILDVSFLKWLAVEIINATIGG